MARWPTSRRHVYRIDTCTRSAPHRGVAADSVTLRAGAGHGRAPRTCLVLVSYSTSHDGLLTVGVRACAQRLISPVARRRRHSPRPCCAPPPIQRPPAHAAPHTPPLPSPSPPMLLAVRTQNIPEQTDTRCLPLPQACRSINKTHLSSLWYGAADCTMPCERAASYHNTSSLAFLYRVSALAVHHAHSLRYKKINAITDAASPQHAAIRSTTDSLVISATLPVYSVSTSCGITQNRFLQCAPPESQSPRQLHPRPPSKHCRSPRLTLHRRGKRRGSRERPKAAGIVRKVTTVIAAASTITFINHMCRNHHHRPHSS